MTLIDNSIEVKVIKLLKNMESTNTFTHFKKESIEFT